ncbi:MAG: hypothetical protein HYZ81_16455 [Nitrospinae bacterium]|nr:hypothetical protein [Nitrospinota bacterium]
MRHRITSSAWKRLQEKAEDEGGDERGCSEFHDALLGLTHWAPYNRECAGEDTMPDDDWARV